MLLNTLITLISISIQETIYFKGGNMEFKVSLEFNIEAESLNEAKGKAYDIVELSPDFIRDNLQITEEHDVELLKLKGYVIISKYRERVVEYLKWNYGMPTEIAFNTGIRQNHISKVLSELREVGILECINPEKRKGRIYQLTELGHQVQEIL